jgi:hypothetical protein
LFPGFGSLALTTVEVIVTIEPAFALEATGMVRMALAPCSLNTEGKVPTLHVRVLEVYGGAETAVQEVPVGGVSEHPRGSNVQETTATLPLTAPPITPAGAFT